LLFICFGLTQQDDVHLMMVATLLGVDKNQLRKWLCARKIVATGDVYVKPLTLAEVSWLIPIEGLSYYKLEPSGQNRCKSSLRSVFLTIWHYILSAELFRLFFWRFCPLGKQC